MVLPELNKNNETISHPKKKIKFTTDAMFRGLYVLLSLAGFFLIFVGCKTIR